MGVKASRLTKMIGVVGGVKRLRGGSAAAPRGYIPILVGHESGESKRYMVHRAAFCDADFLELLSRSAEEYGFCSEGILKIPNYETKDFEQRMGKHNKMLRVGSSSSSSS